MKKLFGVILVIIGVLMLVKTVGNVNFEGWISHTTNQEASASIADIQTIEIQVPSANLEVVQDDRSDFHAALEGRDSDQFNLQVQQHDDTLTVTVDESKSGWFHFADDMKLVVSVPTNYQQNLSVDVDSGKVEVSGSSKNTLMGFQELNLNVSSGDIRLKNLQLKQLNIENTSGSLSADWVKTGEGKLDVTSGDIQLDHYSGALDAELKSGRFDMQVEEVTGDIQVEALSGDVKLELPKNADVSVDAQVTSGHVKSDFPLENTTFYDENKGIQGSSGSGTHKVELEATSGSIKLQ